MEVISGHLPGRIEEIVKISVSTAGVLVGDSHLLVALAKFKFYSAAYIRTCISIFGFSHRIRENKGDCFLMEASIPRITSIIGYIMNYLLAFMLKGLERKFVVSCYQRRVYPETLLRILHVQSRLKANQNQKQPFNEIQTVCRSYSVGVQIQSAKE
jgi:hypothetical protein